MEIRHNSIKCYCHFDDLYLQILTNLLTTMKFGKNNIIVVNLVMKIDWYEKNANEKM